MTIQRAAMLHKAGVRYDKHLKEVTQGDKRCS